MRLYLVGAVRSVGIGPFRPVHRQSLFCRRASARGTKLSAASRRLLNILRPLVRRRLVSGIDRLALKQVRQTRQELTCG